MRKIISMRTKSLLGYNLVNRNHPSLFFFKILMESVNVERYLKVLKRRCLPALQRKTTNFSRSSVWYQQDGATPHTATRVLVMSSQTKHFHDDIFHTELKIMDITFTRFKSLDFFLLGYLKDRVYTDNLDGMKELKNNIKRGILQISSETCRAVIRNFRTHVSKVQKWVYIWSISLEVIVAEKTEMECVSYQ